MHWSRTVRLGLLTLLLLCISKLDLGSSTARVNLHMHENLNNAQHNQQQVANNTQHSRQQQNDRP